MTREVPGGCDRAQAGGQEGRCTPPGNFRTKGGTSIIHGGAQLAGGACPQFGDGQQTTGFGKSTTGLHLLVPDETFQRLQVDSSRLVGGEAMRRRSLSGRRGCTSNRLLTVSRRILRHRMCLHTPSTSRPRTRNLRIIAKTTGFIREPRQNDKRAHADSAASSQATTVAWQRRREGAHKAAPQNIGNCPWSRTVSDMACAKTRGSGRADNVGRVRDGEPVPRSRTASHIRIEE